MRTPWESFKQEALDHLRALVRLDTTNPPGNERRAADYLAAVLNQVGLKPALVEPVSGRTNLIARISGADPAAPPLMLSSHTDVVPVELARWSRAPFGAEIADGCVWGRGTVDMKAKCAMDLVLALAIGRVGVTPSRDLIIAAVADEEAGSQHGARYLVDHAPDLIRAGYVLNESGGFTMHMGGRRFYPVQAAEKGFVTVRMTVRGEPGHGSMPRPDTAIVRMAMLVERRTRAGLRGRTTRLMATTLRELGFETNGAPTFLRPLLANTVAVTMLQAGYKDNVIPGEASAVLDGRILPGESAASFLSELTEIVGPEPALEVIKQGEPVEWPIDTPLFKILATRLEAGDPGAKAIPWMLPGATDSKFYARLGAVCYGFSPVRLLPETPFGSLYHGNDERIPIDGFFWGLRVYCDAVLEFAGLRFDQIFS